MVRVRIRVEINQKWALFEQEKIDIIVRVEIKIQG